MAHDTELETVAVAAPAVVNIQHAGHFARARVSMFARCKDSTPMHSVTLASVIDIIRTGTMTTGAGDVDIRRTIERLRSMTNEDTRKTYKASSVPAFTTCGTFTKRANISIDVPSQYAQVDFDHVGSLQDAADLRDRLRGDPHILCAFISPSGTGTKAIIRSTGLNDDAGMKRLFTVLDDRYGAYHPIDESRKDISGLCLLSYDPDLWLNPDCEPLAVPAIVNVETSARTQAKIATPSASIPVAQHDDAVQHVLNIIRKAERDKETTGASRHQAMLAAQMVAKGYVQDHDIDEQQIRTALRDDYSRMMGGAADRIQDFDRAWAGAKAVPVDLGESELMSMASPAPAQNGGMQRDRMGRIITPAELVIYGKGMPADRYEQMLASATIDTNAKIERPPSLFTFDGNPLLTLQNVSVISGKAKSRKSGFASVLAALAISPNTNRDWQRTKGQRLQAERDTGRGRVLLFDTEQSQYHAWNMARRTLWMADRDDNAGNVLRAYGLRDFTPVDRLLFIAETIDRHAHECSLIIIDGVRDVVMNINSEDEATLMNTWLLSITKQHNIHISCVLHENKTSDTLRGHLGTELMNKAEAVFTVTKGTKKATRDISAVETPVSRNKGMERIGMESVEIDHEGARFWVPALIDDERAERIGAATEGVETSTNAIGGIDQRDLLGILWAGDPSAEYTAADLREHIKVHGNHAYGVAVSDRMAKELISDWHIAKRWIVDNGKATKGRTYRLAADWQDTFRQPSVVPSAQISMMDGGGDVPF